MEGEWEVCLASFPGPTHLSITLPCSKQQKAGRGLGMRLRCACMLDAVYTFTQPIHQTLLFSSKTWECVEQERKEEVGREDRKGEEGGGREGGEGGI